MIGTTKNRLALALAALGATTGCSHTLSFADGRYEVEVASLVAKAHRYQELKVSGLTVSLDKTEVPYEFRGDELNANRSIAPQGDDYTNVMSTIFASVEGHPLATGGVAANALGQTLAATLTRFGFQCGAPRGDAVGDVPGVEVECEARRGASDVQKVRARELWEPEGVVLQTVSWTVGSRAAPEAEKFWASLRIDKTAASPAPTQPPVAVAAVPAGDILWQSLESLQ